MRKALIAALAAVAALAIAAVAFGAAQQKNAGYVKFGSKKAGGHGSVLTHFTITPGADGHIHKHSAVIDIVFPKGIKFNDKVKPYCKATTAAEFDAGACKKSLLAKGKSLADGSHLGVPAWNNLHVTIYAFNRKNGLVLWAVSKEGAPEQVFFPTLKGNVLHTDTSAITNPSFQVDETLFHLNIPNISKGKGKKKIWYMTLPKKCPKSRHWTSKIVFHLQNDQFKNIGKYTATSKQPCHK